MLPLTDTIMFVPRPAPLLTASGLAGGVVAVRRRDLEAVAGPDGTEVLVVKHSLGATPYRTDMVDDRVVRRNAAEPGAATP